MKSFAEKVKDARTELNLSQAQLAEKTGVSLRAIQTYEQGLKQPRQGVLLKLAKVLNVSVKFLTDDNCENPLEDIEKDGYIAEARERYGTKGARDVDALLADNAALFAGGELSQAQKDAFFDAVMKAYITCKEEAKAKFTPRNGG
ncbi:MAG: helix-turn-helix transcriptional regulator [Clostridia bacterium]|nr:helix-turn-helix transcriptional regulator [Clostridia bacterium]MBR6049835.1 helix-turn-helix transcriptional regulator [Clostridia bacterium]